MPELLLGGILWCICALGSACILISILYNIGLAIESFRKHDLKTFLLKSYTAFRTRFGGNDVSIIGLWFEAVLSILFGGCLIIFCFGYFLAPIYGLFQGEFIGLIPIIGIFVFYIAYKKL